MVQPYHPDTQWTFAHRQGDSRTTPLWLYWEAQGDPISDDYSVEECTALDLFRRWIRYLESHPPNSTLGPDWVPIYWSIHGTHTFEFAPFDPMNPTNEDFLTFFHWPTTGDGELVNWVRLPVVDKLWNATQSDKGGFIQEATGWKPGPYQSHLYLPTLVQSLRI